jgi:hypothetical protein
MRTNMNGLIFQLVFVLLFFRGTASCLADGNTNEWDVALQEANRLAQIRLDQYNSTMGIEHIGGPFLLKDFEVTLKREEAPVGKWLQVDYRNRNRGSIRETLDWFNIYVYLRWHAPTEPADKAPPEYAPYSITGEISKEELGQILDAFRLVYRDLGSSVEQIVEIGPDNTVKRSKVAKYGIHNIQKIADDRVQVLFGFASLCGNDGLSINLKKSGDHWAIVRSFWILGHMIMRNEHKVTDLIPGYKPVSGEVQRIRVIGELTDSDMIEIVNLVKKVPNVPADILTATCIRGSEVMVDAGAWRDARRDHLLTLRKENGKWQFERLTTVMNFSEKASLPLLPKPSFARVTSAMEAARVHGKLDRQDLYSVCELVMRIGSVKRDRYMIMVSSPGEVNVMTGTVGGDSVTLRKINGVWVIIGVGGWIS